MSPTLLSALEEAKNDYPYWHVIDRNKPSARDAAARHHLVVLSRYPLTLEQTWAEDAVVPGEICERSW